MVKFCYVLQAYFDAEFWFHVHLEPNRPDWWRIELGSKCKILSRVVFKKLGKYVSLGILRELGRCNPDIVVLGGFGHPSNIIAYYWARLKDKKVVVFTEIARNKKRICQNFGRGL